NYRGLASSSDPDYYQFVITEDTTLTLSLNGVSGGTLTLSGDGISGTETPSSTISNRVLSAGTYYIRVDQSAATSTEYQLTLTGVANNDYPTIVVGLANDTTWYELTNEDGITSDSTVTGEITSVHGVSALQARFTNAPSQSFVNIQSWLQSGSFTLDATTLNSIYGGVLPQGDNILEFRVTDTRGAITTETLTIHLDTLAPTAPTNLTLASVGSTAIRVSGSAEAGALVQLFDGEDPIAEVWATATGSWSVTTSQIRNGTHNLTAKAIDIAGNVSTLSTPLSTTITTLIPSAPQDLQLTAATDTGTSTSDGITTDLTPQITGSAEAGATVRVWREQQLLGETVADANGQWTVAITTDLPEGTYAFRAIAHNANGDSAAATLSVTIDATTPIAQVKTLAAGSESQVVLADGATLTAGTRLTGIVNGTGSAVVSLRYQLGTLPEVTVPVAENGLFIQSLDFGGLSGTQTLTVRSVDLAGNETVQSYTVTLDTTGGGVTVAPMLLAQLTQDTGTADDGWTYAPGIAGIVSDRSQVTGLWATFDPASTATFQDVTALLNADGTFSFDESQLADLTYDGLVDGAYTLRLQVQTATNQTIEKSIQFQLDRSTPTVSLPDVIDGIAWERGMHFLGTVQDNANAVQMVYEIARASDGLSVAQHSFTVAGSLTGTAFDQVLDELTSGNSVLQDEEVYNLIVTSTDVAGNAQRTRFQFFVPGDRRVVDDDPWISPTNPNDPPTDPRTPIPGVTPTAGNLSSWGYVGSGGGWGYYGGSGSGGGWTPGYGGQLTPEEKDDHRGLTGTGYEYEYAESIDEIVLQAVSFISTSPATIHQKAALNNRLNILKAIGNRLNTLIHADGIFDNDETWLEQMRPAMEGLFVDAYDSKGVRAGVYDTFIPWGGAWLAQQLVKTSLPGQNPPKEPLSVREQVFQATLLEVMTEVFMSRQIVMSSELSAAVLELAKTYAWLNPNPETIVPAEGEAFGFLDLLWRLQVPDANGQFKGSGDITAALGQAVTQLGHLLEGVTDPVRAIQFINNLIQAASNVTSFNTDVKNAQFVRELVQFGVAYIKMNPNDAPSSSEDALNAFLNKLWSGEDQHLAQGGLSSLFDGATTLEDRIKVLNFQEKMFTAINMVQELETDRRNPSYLVNVVSVAGSYAISKINSDAGFAYEASDFLKSLWEAETQGDLTLATNRLKAFIANDEVDRFQSSEVGDEYLENNITPFNLSKFTAGLDELLALENSKSLTQVQAYHRNLRQILNLYDVAIRRSILKSPAIMDRIWRLQTDEYAVNLTAALLIGSQNWTQISGPTQSDFGKYFVGQSNNSGYLSETAYMNCYEMILYAGYLAKRITPSQIRDFYIEMTSSFDVGVWEKLGWNETLPEYKGVFPAQGQYTKAPFVGELIFFRPLEGWFFNRSVTKLPTHVGIAINSSDIIHLVGMDDAYSTPDPVRAIGISKMYQKLKGLIQVGPSITIARNLKEWN
ncbi:Ig-like domain-containing protein, partial [Pantanalinema sp. GBBB05]|uniref:Ig-like domain-containing protein n=1 Tax=Pantanalinema sp. GBBB05 TaxID=2604139 RepID=UPI001D4BD93B|nr:hypothetical protein [Pantanalinema sp. GBBB05]